MILAEAVLRLALKADSLRARILGRVRGVRPGFTTIHKRPGSMSLLFLKIYFCK
jgi:hypothetical protein